MEEKNKEVIVETTQEKYKAMTKKRRGSKQKLAKKIVSSFITAVCCMGVSIGLMFFQGCTDEDSSKADKITYTFEVMGGASIEDVSMDKGAEFTLPIPAEREGYRFEGWYLNEQFEGEPVTKVLVETNQTYYAKWAKLSKILIQIDGTETAVYAKAGEKVYDALRSHIPSKSGLTFGAWFSNGKIVETTATVPQNGLTVTPKYKVAYTVEIYVLNKDGYKLSEAIDGAEYVGENYISTQNKVGYSENVAHSDRIAQKVLSDKASNNVFKHYFDPKTYTVTFIANRPDGRAAEEIVEEKVYGDPIYMPNHYTAEGYCLIGWARDQNETTPEFKAYSVDEMLQNKPNGFVPRQSDIFEPTETDLESVTLFGVWVKGYTDMFGGDDHIYLLDEKEGDTVKTVAYLSRGNVFFKGVYDEEYKEFYFVDAEGNYILEGKFYTDDTFAYYSEKRSGYIAYLYSVGKGIDESIQIEFDNANGVTYKVAGQTDTKGTQTVKDGGEYVADFTNATEGYLKGQTITFMTGTYGGRNAFIMLNEAERDMGTLQRFYYNPARNAIMMYPSGTADIRMNGYGVATYTTANGASNYYYTYENGVITLTSQYGGFFGEAIVTTIQGEVGYVLYTKWQDTELKIKDGVTLKLDGGINAVYNNGSEIINGYYTVEESNFGGYIIRMTSSENKKYTFMVKGTLTDEGVLQVGYRVEVKDNAYGEYRYLADGMVYNAALIVIEDDENLSLYGYDKRANSFVKVSDGTYELSQDKDGYYQYNAKNFYSCSDIIDKPVDPSVVKSFKFALDSETTSYNVFYWETMTDKNDNVVPYVEVYTCATSDENTTLKLVGGFAYYSLKGVPYSGPYALYEDEGYIMIITSDATGSQTFYVAIDETAKTFSPLQYQPYTAYLYDVNGEIRKEEGESISMYFDGKGNATYVNKGDEAIVGSIKEIGKEQGAIVYEFKSAELTFTYLLANKGSTRVFIRSNDDYKEKYITSSAILELNGYGTYGVYETYDNIYSGQYLIVEENVISLKDSASGKTFYFDIDGNSFTVRSEEYGIYLWIDNQNWIEETYFEFDGYGVLRVYTLKEVKDGDKVINERVYIDEAGTYEKIGGVYKLIWNEKPEGLIGELGRYYNSKAFIVKLDESEKEENKKLVGLYINESDWSVLILDDVGNAIKYADEGEKEVGYYTLITDTLLYYVNAANTDACLYEYDALTRTATQVKYSDKTRYLTEDMATLTFYEYGYLVSVDKEGKQERYYYYKNGADIDVYVSSPKDTNANDYGFVKYTLVDGFNEVLDNLPFSEEEFFKNDDDSLTFTRVGEIYPILQGGNSYALSQLTFDASTEIEFSSEGKVVLTCNGVSESVDCIVLREINQDGIEKTYILLADYRFEVEFIFKGMAGNSTYAIVAMQEYRVVYANSFLNNYAYYAGFGYRIENTVGEITIHGSFKEDGTPEQLLVDVTFLEDSNVKDDYGNLIQVKNAIYKQHPEGYYSATFTIEKGETEDKTLADSYTYSLYFAIGRHGKVNAYAFNVVAMTRHQAFTDGEYEILAERVVATELIRFEKGDLFNVCIKKNGVDLGGSLVKSKEVIQFVDGKGLYVVRTKDGDKYTGATYYEVVIESEPVMDSVDGETKVPMYKAITVEKLNTEITKILYSIDGKYFADFTQNGVGVITLVNETFITTASEEIAEADLHAMYKPTDGSTIVKTYKATTTAIGRYFMVQIRSKVVDGTEVTYLYIQEVLDEA